MTIILYDYPAYAVLNNNINLPFISINWETAMTSQGHVTAASLKQADNEYMEGRFLSACISKSSAHPSLRLHTVNLGTLNNTMWKFNHDQTNNHRVINKSFCV